MTNVAVNGAAARVTLRLQRPLTAHGTRPWPAAKPLSSRSRPRCCSRPMPAASSRWRKAPRTRRSIGSSRKSAASSRWTTFHVPARLARTVRSDRFSIAVNRDFDGVLDGCAEPQPGRARTWINARIRTLYREALRHRPLPQRRGLRGRRAGRRALRRLPRPRVLRREHVPPRARRLEGRAGASGGAAAGRRLRAARHPVRHRPSEDVRRRSKCRAAQYHKLLEAALVGEADFAALRREHDRRGGAAAARRRRSGFASRRRQLHRAGGGRRRQLRGAPLLLLQLLRAAAAAASAAACARGGAARARRGASATAGCGAPLQSVSHTS